MQRPPLIDLYASQPHYLDHLLAASEYLHPRRVFVHTDRLVEYAATRGVVAVRGKPSGDGPPVVIAGYRDLSAVGETRKVALVEHGAGQTYSEVGHMGYAGGPGWERLSMVLVPGPHARERWERAYPDLDVVPIGCPRLDGVPAQAARARRPVVAFTFHWPCEQCPETRSAFRDWQRQIVPLVRSGRYTILGHWHPRWETRSGNRVHTFWKRLGVETTPTLDAVWERAHVLVADNSSALYEFAALDRPVVVLNARGYRRDVEHGLRFWTHVPGHLLDPDDDLSAGIDAALHDDSIQRELRAAATFQAYGAIPAKGARWIASGALRGWVQSRARA